MIDLKCDGEPASTTQGHAYLIIYRIEGNHSDVPADVYNAPFIFENNRMVMETNLDLNNHQIIGMPFTINNGMIMQKNINLNGYQIISLPFTINNEMIMQNNLNLNCHQLKGVYNQTQNSL